MLAFCIHLSYNLIVLNLLYFHTKNFLTELASGKVQLDDITKLGEELVKKQHSKTREIQSRHAQVTQR